MSKCYLCPRNCGVERDKGEVGYCGVLYDMVIARYSLHLWEEPCLCGEVGSGTIFFSYCNLGCCFCQNYEISTLHKGRVVSVEEFSDICLELQDKGAININLVTGCMYVPLIVKGLKLAKERGLKIPVVYNTSSYENVSTIRMLDGLVDIYLPDLKYVFDDKAIKYSRAENYFNVAINAIEIMKSQVGDLTVNDNGIAERGIIIRHLILPNNESDSYDVLIELKERGFLKSTISLMSQYNPKFKALDFENINRKLYKKEYDDVVDYALDLGFENLLVQEMESSENYLPDFTKEKPFQM